MNLSCAEDGTGHTDSDYLRRQKNTEGGFLRNLFRYSEMLNLTKDFYRYDVLYISN